MTTTTKKIQIMREDSLGCTICSIDEQIYPLLLATNLTWELAQSLILLTIWKLWRGIVNSVLQFPIIQKMNVLSSWTDLIESKIFFYLLIMNCFYFIPFTEYYIFFNKVKERNLG